MAFPAITMASKSYLVVFASSKDRRDPGRPLHTNFSLDADGEYLGLIRPDGITVATAFAPAFPPQRADISYGTTCPSGKDPQLGYLRTATPNAPNRDSLILPETVVFSRNSGPFTDSVVLEISGAKTGQHVRYVLTEPSAAGRADGGPH